MVERYNLNQITLPTIPVPHDCVVTNILEDDEYLIFLFEEDISYHDSIQAIHPSAKGLTIRFHKTDGFREDMELYQYTSFKHQSGYMSKKPKRLFELTAHRKRPVEYLEHFVASNTMIIHLFSKNSIMLRLFTDYVEFEWIEQESYIENLENDAWALHRI